VKHFFISYNSADKNWAEWIAWQLEEAGYTTILQAWDFRPGHNFVLEMDRASKEAERTIIVLSPDFLSSSFTPSEWAVAFKKDPTGEKGMIVPVRVRKCEPDGLLSTISRIDLMGLDEEAAKKALLDGVEFERAKPTTPPGYPGSRSVTEKPRFPGALPPVWNVPFNRNPNFTGRESLLADLRAALTSGLPVALHGLGGMGKTQLAVQYAYSHMANYEVVWWIRSEESATLASDFADLANDLDLPTIDDQRKIIKAVRRCLGQNKDWLLIFDNAEKPADIRDYLPQGGRGHVIVTSRDSTDWGSMATALEVKKFDRAESIEFLHKRTKQEDEVATGALAEELDGLPLALEQAGAYILAKGITLDDYLELFQTRRKELWKDEKPPKDYRDKVDTTWNLAMDQVKEEVPEGVDLLNLCAFLAPDDIPRSLFCGGNEHLVKSLTDTLTVNRAVDALRRYSLIDASYESLSVHKLVQAVTRDRLSDEERKGWAETAVLLVNGAFPQKSQDFRTWDVCSVLLPHAIAAAVHAERLEAAQKETQHLLNKVGLYLCSRAEFREAEALLKQALTIAENVFGSEHNEVAATINNLGRVLQDMGNLDGAKKCYERALEINEAIYGLSHPQVAKIVNNFGLVLRDQGELDGARKCYERALKIDEATYGSEHSEVAVVVNNLGGVLYAMGNLDGAKKCFERAIDIDEEILGLYHPDMATRINNLGMVLLDMDDILNAKKHIDRALEINEKVLGPDHPNTAKTINNLGKVLQRMGNLKDAKKCYEKALKIDEKVLGPDHPEVAIRLNNLGLILKYQGNLKGARKCYKRALKILWEQFGDDHPSTKIVRKNLKALGR